MIRKKQKNKKTSTKDKPQILGMIFISPNLSTHPLRLSCPRTPRTQTRSLRLFIRQTCWNLKYRICEAALRGRLELEAGKPGRGKGPCSAWWMWGGCPGGEGIGNRWAHTQYKLNEDDKIPSLPSEWSRLTITYNTHCMVSLRMHSSYFPTFLTALCTHTKWHKALQYM